MIVNRNPQPEKAQIHVPRHVAMLTAKAAVMEAVRNVQSHYNMDDYDAYLLLSDIVGDYCKAFVEMTAPLAERAIIMEASSAEPSQPAQPEKGGQS